jgi:4a-hydroxytetrahydrobiopterin dehydratase
MKQNYDPNNLSAGHCVPCEGGMLPIDKVSAEVLIKNIPNWAISTDGLSIHRDFKFPDFKTALEFTNAVGAIAESEGHHPDIELSWGKVGITLSTHAIGGLSGNDFILAAKIDVVL